MGELGEKVFNEVDKWWNERVQQGYAASTIDLIEKTIDLMEEAFVNHYTQKMEERVEEIAMQRAKDINGIPVRTLIAKDIATTIIASARLNTNVSADIARASVDMTDELLKALKR